MATKQYRWICSTCQTAKLGPSRLRKIDVRRYCLVCSEKTGFLVERVVPKFEAKREKSRARSAAKVKRARQTPEAKAERIATANLRRFARRRARFTETANPHDVVGWLHVHEAHLSVRHMDLGITVRLVGHAYYVPPWVCLLETPGCTASGLKAIARAVARNKQRAAGALAAGLISPWLGALFAVEHCGFTVAPSILEAVRERAAPSMQSDPAYLGA